MLPNVLAREFGVNAALLTPGTLYALAQGVPAQAPQAELTWDVALKTVLPILLSGLLALARLAFHELRARRRKAAERKERAALRAAVPVLSKLQMRTDDPALRAEAEAVIRSIEELLV